MADHAPVGPSRRALAVVTGASGGIGEAYARQLAGTHDLVLVARSADRLQALAADLTERHPSGAFAVVATDLAVPYGIDPLLEHLTSSGASVDLLVNNAGVGTHGPVADADPVRTQGVIQLNCVTLVALTQALLPGMVARGRGGVINVASTAAFQPTPSMAVYGASKAFVLSFSEALSVETRNTGVHVIAVCPGATETGFFAAAGSSFLTSGRQSPEQVVTESLAAYERRRTVVVTGLANKIKAQAHRFVPRAVLARASAEIVRER